MSFTEFAFRMFPYWSLGAVMAFAIWKSDYKDLLRFEPKTFGKFFLFMLALSVFRYEMVHFAAHHGMAASFNAVKSLPIGGVFFVPWEDLAFSVPLVLLRLMIGTSKWTWPIHAVAMAVSMIGFGTGHVYEGIFGAMLVSLYIPYAVGFIKNHGAGTVMASHILYDLMTIMTIRLALG